MILSQKPTPLYLDECILGLEMISKELLAIVEESRLSREEDEYLRHALQPKDGLEWDEVPR